jgi:predicted dehydrogenase
MYNAAIIGAGRIGVEFEDCHARAYKDHPSTELVAIFDRQLDKADKAADKWNVPIVGDQYWGMGELGLDIVSICTPPQTHLGVVKDVLVCNPNLKAIYCEKPITIILEEAREMVAVCKEAGVLLVINHQRRFGTPTFTFSRGLFNTGTHMVDLLRQYFGEVKNVTQDCIHFERISVNIQELDIQGHVFELKIPTHDLIVRGVRHIVDCLDNGTPCLSTGEDGLKDIEVLWKLKEHQKYTTL